MNGMHNYNWRYIFTTLKNDISIIVATYAVVAAYCFICSRQFENVEEIRQLEMLQLYADSVVPTTITIVLASILQSFFAGKRRIKNFFHGSSLVGIVIFSLLTAGYHPINDVQGLLAVIIGSGILIVLNLGMVFEEQINSDTRIGVSGIRE